MRTTITNIDCIEKVFTNDAELIEYTQAIFQENYTGNDSDLIEPKTVAECLAYIATYTEHELETDIKF